MARSHIGIARPLAFRSVRDLTLGAFFGGLAAGVAMAIFTMVAFAVGGMNVGVPFRIVAATANPQWALASGAVAAPVVFGVLVHLAISVAFAFAFAGLIGLAGPVKAVGWGLVYGIALAFVMRFAVLPTANPLFTLAPPGLFLIAHVVYGLSLGLIPVVGKWADRRHPLPEPW